MSRAFSVPPIVSHLRDRLVPYTMDGPDYAKMTNWLPVTYDEKTRCGSYYFQLLPGGYTAFHEHAGYEEFYIIEGEAVESDGTVLKAGDFISFPPGSYHNTRSENGVLALVVEWQP